MRNKIAQVHELNLTKQTASDQVPIVQSQLTRAKAWSDPAEHLLFYPHSAIIHVRKLANLFEEFICSFMAVLHLGDPNDHAQQPRAVTDEGLEGNQLLLSIQG
jgi:hypothetical protein